jgi:two-component system CheB/CheR fusion protein
MLARKMRRRSLRSGLPDEPMHVVGIGASAGGLEPLQELLQRFTADTTAFVVTMHLSPTHESLLATILSKSSKMSVSTATDSQILRKNCIYVIPPGFLLTLTAEGTLRLTSLPPSHPRRTIDNFFSSLSEIGRASIGVILSGMGADGSQGLKAIQSRGGTTFVQEPDSAAFPQMPRNARPFADYCLEPPALGDALMVTVGAVRKDQQRS